MLSLCNIKILLTIICSMALQSNHQVEASQTMKRLYEDLFTDYNKLIIPIAPNRTRVTVTVGLKLGQILDLNLKQQILSTNVWVEQAWHDYRLEWDPNLYEGISMIHVPAENIWIPDIVLFNNADGNYELTLVAKAVLYSNGTVIWKPPTMFRSTCEIDVEFFPFDIQTCFLRFGSWSYAGDELEIRHVGQQKRKVEIGIDLSQFYKNVEWDIIDVPAYYNENYYECCQEPYPDITFKIVIRRKMLFYLVNLILPVALMTFMTVSVFYLPADSNEKVTLSISILTSLIVFFLLMLEVIPPTSLAVPLFGKYLLFTLVLVSLSACVSVYVLNIYHRSPSVHQMSPKMRKLFLKTLPKLLRLDRPDPRERSSLNRFRKKKIAQQILQARQSNKVYDLARPLAASLNLIETLHKSYEINPRDDTAQSSKLNERKSHGFSIDDDDDEEGRYFRRYVDNYIDRLKSEQRDDTSHQQHHLVEKANNQRQSSIRSRREVNGLFEQKQSRSCCEHRPCCQKASTRYSQANRDYLRGQQLHPDWTNESSEKMRPLVSNNASSCKGCLSKTNANLATHHPFGMVNDDTLDMTFDYEDQDETGLASGHLQQQHQKMMMLDNLPSPPPPPKQVTQLGDSMRDLSAGRLSACDGQNQAAGCGGFGQEATDQFDRLIKSINLINNASDDVDTTTTSNSPQTLELNNIARSESKHLLATPTRLMQQQQQQIASHHTNQLAKPLDIDSSFDDDTKQTCSARLIMSSKLESATKCTCINSVKQSEDVRNKIMSLDSCNCQRFTTAYNKSMDHHSVGNSIIQQQQQKQSNTETPHDALNHKDDFQPSELLMSLKLPYDRMPAHVRAAIRSILFIADTIKNEDDENSAIEDWESVSMVVDRLFLWIFFILCTFGSLIILALAPSLYDQRDSIDDKLRVDIPPSNCSALNSSE